MAVASKVKARKTQENSPPKSPVEEVLAHGINFTAARVSQAGPHPLTGLKIVDYKTAEAGDRLGACVPGNLNLGVCSTPR